MQICFHNIINEIEVYMKKNYNIYNNKKYAHTYITINAKKL